MSTAPATGTSKGGIKKLLLIGGVAVLLALIGVGVALLLGQKDDGRDEDDDYDLPASAARAQPPAQRPPKPGAPPTFLPLDVFTVNLADRPAERYAQIGVTLEVDSPEMAERLKAYMPAIRNNVLMAIAHRTSEELLDRAGKERLADEIMRESVRPMGIEIDETPPADDPSRRTRRRPVYNPVVHVHFSSFIIQ